MISIYFPVKPIAKGRPRFVNGHPKILNGRVFTDKKTHDFEKRLYEMARAEYHGDPMSGPLFFHAVFSMPIPKSKTKSFKDLCAQKETPHTSKPDLDNLSKVKDAFNGILWKDDSQISEECLTKIYETDNYPTGIYVKVGEWKKRFC